MSTQRNQQHKKTVFSKVIECLGKSNIWMNKHSKTTQLTWDTKKWIEKIRKYEKYEKYLKYKDESIKN